MSLPVYGIDKELAAKQQAKYDPQREREAREWIEAVTGEPLPSASFQESLKNGAILCKIFQTIQPGSIKSINSSKLPFKEMENINNFLLAAEKLGVPKGDLFQTIDLYENKNINQVVDAIFAVARHAQKHGLHVPQLGPKLADKHEVEFSSEQLAQGKTIIGLQMGLSAKDGANQSGMAYGARRQIDAKVGAGEKDTVVSLQYGTNAGANQSGIAFGARRQIDAKTGSGATDAPPSLQYGTNAGANASGVSFGAHRQIGGSDPANLN